VSLAARLAERSAELPDSRTFPCGACGNGVEVSAYWMAAWMAMSELDRRQGGQGLRVSECVRCAPCYRAHREGLYSDVTKALEEAQAVCRMVRQGMRVEQRRLEMALAGPFSASVKLTVDGVNGEGGSDELG
jgi:hypothetical protein